MQSYALRPSSDTSTASGRRERAARAQAARASVPARAWSANWYGRVAWSKVWAHSLASVLKTRRRKTSPVAIPRTPPSGLRKAVSRAMAKPAAMSEGTLACARHVAASVSNSNASKSWKSNFKCSALIPERPAAPPRRASRSAVATAREDKRRGSSGWYCSRCCGSAARAAGGRLAGSVKASQVASVPGASSAAVRTCLARESSPWRTLAQACSRFRSARASASS